MAPGLRLETALVQVSKALSLLDIRIGGARLAVCEGEEILLLDHQATMLHYAKVAEL